MNKWQNIGKGIGRGVLISIWIIFLLYIGFLYYFYELNLQCKLWRDNAALKAQEIYLSADIEAKEAVAFEQIAAQRDLLKAQGEWIPRLGAARSKGLKEYIVTFREYKQATGAALEDYRNRTKALRAEAAKIKITAHKAASELISSAREEANPLMLLFRESALKRPVEGYFYDPNSGDISPRLGVPEVNDAL